MKKYEIVGNIKINFDPAKEKKLYKEFDRVCDSFIITRETGQSLNEHYHFHLIGCKILDKSLKDNLYKLFTELKTNPNSDKKQNKNGTLKGYERKICCREVLVKKPFLTPEQEYEYIVCYVYKDIVVEHWEPLTKGVIDYEAKQKRYYELVKLKEDLRIHNAKEKKKESKNFIPKLIQLVKDQNTLIGADGEPFVRKVTLLDISEVLSKYYLENEKTLNRNTIENQIVTIYCHFSKSFKDNYFNTIIEKIKDNYLN